jgi:hypothetical protein
MWKAWLTVAALAGRAVADPTPPSSCKPYRPYLEPMLLYLADFTNDLTNHAIVRAASGLRYRDCDGGTFRHQLNIGLSAASEAYGYNWVGGVELDFGWHVGAFVIGPHAAIESAFSNDERVTEWTFGARARALDAFVLELDLIRGNGPGVGTPIGMLAGVGLTGKAGAIGTGVVVGATLAAVAIFIAAGGFGGGH